MKRKMLDLVNRIYLATPSPLIRRTHSIYTALRILDDFESNEYANLSFLEEGMKEHPNSIDDNYHENIVKRLANSYRRAKDMQRNVPLAYKPGGGWKELIKIRLVEYLEALNSNDTSNSKLSNLLRNFFRNSGSNDLNVDYLRIADANIIGKEEFIVTFLKSYEIWKDFVGGNLKKVSAPHICNPWGYYIEGNLIMRYSFRHHYFATRVKNLLADRDNPVVAEIGGGYGGFAYYLLKEKDDLTYINFDLPEILLISSYYLMNAFPDKKILLFEEAPIEKISLETINSYDIILLPNFELPKLESDSVDLFINTGSLSEMDFSTIEEYISQIVRICKRYFFHENSNRKEFIAGGHIEVPASQFPIPDNLFKRIYKFPSLLTTERYSEYLYERIDKVSDPSYSVHGFDCKNIEEGGI
jgi:hypothetical protein